MLRLSDLVLELQQELEHPPTVQTQEQAPIDGEAKLLLVVDDEKGLTERLSVDAPAKGLRAEIVDSLSSARAAIAHQRPDVVLLSLSISSVVEESGVIDLPRMTPMFRMGVWAARLLPSFLLFAYSCSGQASK